jgi:hypothetical protein
MNMTLTLNRILHSFLARTARSGRGSGTIARLDTLLLSGHDLADLNLPVDIRLRIENARDAGKVFTWR